LIYKKQTVRLVVNNDLDYITKKKIRVLKKKEEKSILDDRERRTTHVKDWNVKQHPADYVDPSTVKPQVVKPRSAPNITDRNFSRMLLQVSKGTKKASDFKVYFCGNINANVVANKKSMSFIELCQRIANKKIKITAIDLDKEKGTNCIQNVSIKYNKGFL